VGKQIQKVEFYWKLPLLFVCESLRFVSAFGSKNGPALIITKKPVLTNGL
jgi:hypothetical protein